MLDFPNLGAPLQKYQIINQLELNIKETTQFILHSAGSELQWLLRKIQKNKNNRKQRTYKTMRESEYRGHSHNNYQRNVKWSQPKIKDFCTQNKEC